MWKYWNALRFGNAKTKRILWSVIGLSLLMLGGIIRAAAGGGAVWMLVAAFSLIMIIVLLQSVRFGDVELRQDKKKERAKGKKEKAAKEILKKEFAQLSDITQEDIQQLLISYRVNKEHILVVIDSFEEEGIHQSAAYLWKDRGYLQILVLEGKPRNIAVPLRQITEITCRREVEINPSREYEELRKPSVVNLACQELLPTYAERRRANGRKYYTKNLYVLGPGIALTNTSVRNLQKILPLPITIEGLSGGEDSLYYQEARRMKLLLLDKILTAAEYKEKISAVLKEMADRQPKNSEFAADMERMVRQRLVTHEVAAYFLEYRKKKKK